MGALVFHKRENGPESDEGITKSQPCLTIINQHITSTIMLARTVASHSVVRPIAKLFRVMSFPLLMVSAW